MIALGIFFTIMGAIFILCGLTSIDSFGGTFFLISAAVTALGVFLWCMGRRREADIMEQEQEAIQNGTTPPKRKGPIFATIIFLLIVATPFVLLFISDTSVNKAPKISKDKRETTITTTTVASQTTTVQTTTTTTTTKAEDEPKVEYDLTTKEGKLEYLRHSDLSLYAAANAAGMTGGVFGFDPKEDGIFVAFAKCEGEGVDISGKCVAAALECNYTDAKWVFEDDDYWNISFALGDVNDNTTKIFFNVHDDGTIFSSLMPSDEVEYLYNVIQAFGDAPLGDAPIA